MTKKQRALLLQMAIVLSELSEECTKDENFHNIIIKNNDLIPLSLDELSCEWIAIANGERK